MQYILLVPGFEVCFFFQTSKIFMCFWQLFQATQLMVSKLEPYKLFLHNLHKILNITDDGILRLNFFTLKFPTEYFLQKLGCDEKPLYSIDRSIEAREISFETPSPPPRSIVYSRYYWNYCIRFIYWGNLGVQTLSKLSIHRHDPVHAWRNNKRGEKKKKTE